MKNKMEKEKRKISFQRYRFRRWTLCNIFLLAFGITTKKLHRLSSSLTTKTKNDIMVAAPFTFFTAIIIWFLMQSLQIWINIRNWVSEHGVFTTLKFSKRISCGHIKISKACTRDIYVSNENSSSIYFYCVFRDLWVKGSPTRFGFNIYISLSLVLNLHSRHIMSILNRSIIN